MLEFPYHIKYTLSRWQRLRAHLGVWRPYGMGPLALLGCLGLSVGETLATGRINLFYWALAATLMFLLRNFVLGVINIILVREQPMNLIIEQNGLGLRGGEDWLHLDGLTRVELFSPRFVTLYHYNGMVVNIPTSEIPGELIDYFKGIPEKTKSKEWVDFIIERGRLIEEIEKRHRRWSKWAQETAHDVRPEDGTEQFPPGVIGKSYFPLYGERLEDGCLEVTCANYNERGNPDQDKAVITPDHPLYEKWSRIAEEAKAFAEETNGLKGKLLEMRRIKIT